MQSSRVIYEAFAVIQHIMGDIDQPVDGIRGPFSDVGFLDLSHSGKGSTSLNRDQVWNKAEKKFMLEEER